MAIRVYKVAVVGCPRAILSSDGYIEGVGKSCLCNKFVRSEAYSEDHQQDWSVLSQYEWEDNPVFNGDHFVYWGAANKHLPDKTRVRFQVVEQSEFYCSPRSAHSSSDESDSEEEEEGSDERKKVDTRLKVQVTQEDYVTRASSVHFRSRKAGKMAYRLKAVDAAVRQSLGPVRAATQLFPNEEFGGKKSMGVYGFICVFDPTLEGEYMQKQLSFLSELLPSLVKTKRKVVIACVKCDAVEDHAIRFGSKLSSYALKKTVPFFEVSARESVNVDDVFFSLVSAPKKSKNGSRGGSGSLSYREVVDSRKGDLNRAKDGFRKYLQLIVTDFASTWNGTLPLLKMDHCFQSVQQLAGREADTTLLKLFQLRLIEIKLKEAGQEYGNSLVKKADKEKSKRYQVYLKEAFSEHPDLRDDSTYREYLPSISDEMDTVLTEPSTPSSTCYTPELADVTARVTRLRSATLSDLPEAEGLQGNKMVNKSIDDLVNNQQNKKGKYWKKHFSFANASVDKIPPPLPSRDTGAAAGAPKTSQGGSGSDSLSSSSAKRLSSSTDCLFSPEENQPANLNRPGRGISYDRLDAAPYLQPKEVKIVLQKSSESKLPDNSKDDRRNTAGFLSMRSPRRGKQLHTVAEKDAVFDDGGNKPWSTNSLERRTHKRTRSNPFILDGMKLDAAHTPPELPPRNLDTSVAPSSTHTTPNHVSGRRDSALTFIESSLEFSSPTSADAWRTGDKPLMSLPPLPDEADIPVVTRMRLHTSEDDDNISQSSGPFEEIESVENSTTNLSPLLSTERGAGILRSATMGRKPEERGPGLLRSVTLGRLGFGTKASNSNSENSDGDDDQYAEIEDFQQYMEMASVPVDKSKTYPLHLLEEGSDGPSTPSKKSHKSTSAMVVRASTMKKEAATGAPIISTLRKKLKKSQRSDQLLDGRDGQSPPPPPPHKSGTSPTLMTKQPVDNRPLPPSPIKGVVTRKISSGSNIYEVIDEEFIHKVRNRPSRHNSQREAIADWLPDVDRSLLPKYMEVVRKFFSLPQIQEQWCEMVKSVIKDVDPSEILPPYSKVCSEPRFGSLNLEEEEVLKEEDELEEERDTVTPLQGKIATLKKGHKPHSPAPPTAATKDNSSPTTSSTSSPVVAAPKTSGSLALERLLRVGAGAASAPVADHGKVPAGKVSTTNGLKASTGSDELILMLNQAQAYESDYTSGTDSDEELDDDLESDSSELDFDLDVPLFLNQTPPEVLLEKRTQGAREALLSQTSADLTADDLTTPIAMESSPLPDEASPEIKQAISPPVNRSAPRVSLPITSPAPPSTSPHLSHTHLGHTHSELQENPPSLLNKTTPQTKEGAHSPTINHAASPVRLSHASPKPPAAKDRAPPPLQKVPSPLLKRISPSPSPLLGRTSPIIQQVPTVKERAPSPLLNHLTLDRREVNIRQKSPDLLADAWFQGGTDIDLDDTSPELWDEKTEEEAPPLPLHSHASPVPPPEPESAEGNVFHDITSLQLVPGEQTQPTKLNTHFFSSSSPDFPLPQSSRGSVPHKHPSGRSQPPAVKPKPRRISVPQTDLDTALELRASVSNDSGTDSGLTKSPHSNAEFDLGGSESEDAEKGAQNPVLGGHAGEGRSVRLGSGEVEIVPNVRPSQFLKSKGRARYRLKSREGSVSEDNRSRTDSGTFEESTDQATHPSY